MLSIITVPYRDPTNYELITYAWVLLISVWGGTAAFIRRVRRRHNAVYSIAEWLGECCISGFVGVCTFYLCEFAGVDRTLTAVLIAITAHMGSRAVLLGETFLMRYIERKTGVNTSDAALDAQNGDDNAK
jgi:hypothetical protein